eukprot:6461468-Amphidinium_carterae.1
MRALQEASGRGARERYSTCNIMPRAHDVLEEHVRSPRQEEDERATTATLQEQKDLRKSCCYCGNNVSDHVQNPFYTNLVVSTFLEPKILMSGNDGKRERQEDINTIGCM